MDSRAKPPALDGFERHFVEVMAEFDALPAEIRRVISASPVFVDPAKLRKFLESCRNAGYNARQAADLLVDRIEAGTGIPRRKWI